MACKWPEQRLLTLLISSRRRKSITGTIRFTELKWKWFVLGGGVGKKF
jgi:hypothetical protein